MEDHERDRDRDGHANAQGHWHIIELPAQALAAQGDRFSS
jgi:hypothetical protein